MKSGRWGVKGEGGCGGEEALVGVELCGRCDPVH